MDWKDALKFITHFAVLIGLIKYIYFRRKRNQALNQRLSHSFDDFYNKYYLNSRLNKESVNFLLTELSEKLVIPEGKLLPTDRLEDLAPITHRKTYHMEIQDFFDIAHERIKRLQINSVESQHETIDQYLRLFGRYSKDELLDPWDFRVLFKKIGYWVKGVFKEERV